jgi:hypothetical protein
MKVEIRSMAAQETSPAVIFSMLFGAKKLSALATN